MELSEDQQRAMSAIQQWFFRGDSEFRMGGLAGTGKTTIVTHLFDWLDVDPDDVHYCAPTGKAASVLQRKLNNEHIPSVATTIHGLMYKPAESHCRACDVSRAENEVGCHGYGSCGCRVSFVWNPPEVPPPLLIVDEASMVGKEMYEDLQALGTQVLFVGDHGQLPPVRGGVNLMDEKHLDFRLEKIHRQAAGDAGGAAILRLSRAARDGVSTPVGEYAPGVEVVSGKQFSFDPEDGALLLCYTNENRVRLNSLVRKGLGLPKGTPVVGDKVVCLRNNRDVGIANGMLGEIMEIAPVGLGNVLQAVIKMQDSDVVFRGRILAAPFNDPEAMPIRGVDHFTYGYCLTVHKAQGSEAEKVIVFKEAKMAAMSPGMRKRWLYTAYTRAKKELTVVEA